VKWSGVVTSLGLIHVIKLGRQTYNRDRDQRDPNACSNTCANTRNDHFCHTKGISTGTNLIS